jgi:hypothetical protein
MAGWKVGKPTKKMRAIVQLRKQLSPLNNLNQPSANGIFD